MMKRGMNKTTQFLGGFAMVLVIVANIGIAIFSSGCTPLSRVQSGESRGPGGVVVSTSSEDVSVTTTVTPTPRAATNAVQQNRPSLFGNLRFGGSIPDDLEAELLAMPVPEKCWPGEGWLCTEDGIVWINLQKTHTACYGGFDPENIAVVGNWSALWHRGYGSPVNKWDYAVVPMGYWASRGEVHHDWVPFFLQIVDKSGGPGEVEGFLWGKQGGACTVPGNSQSWKYLPGMLEGIGAPTGEADSGTLDIQAMMVPDESARWGYSVAFPNIK